MTHPDPLRGPAFGSYAPDEVGWLLTDLSGVALEAPTEEREEAVQSGGAHYAESLPQEYQPDAEYLQLYRDALAGSAQRLAQAVGTVTELVLAERGQDVVLVSLARAGTPVGILLRRWAAARHGLELPHYAVSIVRGRGIDPLALRHLAEHHDPARVVFVDGWTGKGAIARELADALAEHRDRFGSAFDPELAVLADPGRCASTFGTRDDWLIPSACLNSTVSGLVSRTVLNTRLLRPDQYHGAKFYAELARGRRLERLPGRGERRVRRRARHHAPGRPGAGLGRLGGHRTHRGRVRHRRGEPGQAGRRRDHPGAAAPGPVAGAGPRGRAGRGPGPRAAARAAPRGPGRGGDRAALQLRRPDPPPVHPRRDRVRRPGGGSGRGDREGGPVTVVCLDLDRTVIYSAAALDLRMPDEQAPRLLCVEVYRGVPLSFLTEAAVRALLALQEVATVVPTTTRTPEQLARVRLPGRPARYAIAANGGQLLVDGVPDPDWTAAVRQRLAGCAPLAEVQAQLRARGGTLRAEPAHRERAVRLRRRRPRRAPRGMGGGARDVVRPRAAGRCRCRAARSTRCPAR